VSDHESMDSRKVCTPQQFAAAIAETKTTDRATYTPVYLSDCAADMTGELLHLQSVIDNGQPGGICVAMSTPRHTKHVKANTFLRILIECEHVVDMSH